MGDVRSACPCQDHLRTSLLCVVFVYRVFTVPRVIAPIFSVFFCHSLLFSAVCRNVGEQCAQCHDFHASHSHSCSSARYCRILHSFALFRPSFRSPDGHWHLFTCTAVTAVSFSCFRWFSFRFFCLCFVQSLCENECVVF